MVWKSKANTWTAPPFNVAIGSMKAYANTGTSNACIHFLYLLIAVLTNIKVNDNPKPT